jgi:hypothetical protein
MQEDLWDGGLIPERWKVGSDFPNFRENRFLEV